MASTLNTSLVDAEHIMNTTLRCLVVLFFCLMAMAGCGDNAETDTDPNTHTDAVSVDDGEQSEQEPTTGTCEDKWCGESCGEHFSDGFFCDADGACRDIQDEELYCPSDCLDADCGASCQPPCPIGARCGFIAPGYCNPEGECVLEDPSTPDERPFECPEG